MSFTVPPQTVLTLFRWWAEANCICKTFHLCGFSHGSQNHLTQIRRKNIAMHWLHLYDISSPCVYNLTVPALKVKYSKSKRYFKFSLVEAMSSNLFLLRMMLWNWKWKRSKASLFLNFSVFGISTNDIVCTILNAHKMIICPQETFSFIQVKMRKKVLTGWNMASHFEQKVCLWI